MPISSLGNSSYAKGPFTHMSSSSSKYARLQNSVPRSYEGHSLDMNSAGRGSRTTIGGSLSRKKYIEIDKKNLPGLPIY